MRRIFSSFAIFSCVAYIAALAVAGEADPSREMIEKAREAYRSAFAKVQREIGAKIQTKIDDERKKGNRDAMLRAKKEKRDLDGGVFPKDLLTEDHRKQLKEAIKNAMDAFDQAIEDYTKKNQDGKAEKVENEKQDFVKDSDEIRAIVFPPEEMDPKAKTGKGKSAESKPIDAWGRCEKPAPSGPKCFIWQDKNGWHLQASTDHEKHEFKGTIEVVKGKLILLEADGIELKGKTKDELQKTKSNLISFTLNCKGDSKGFNFKLSKDASHLSCFITIDKLDKSKYLYIGNQGQNPMNCKFELQVMQIPSK